MAQINNSLQKLSTPEADTKKMPDGKKPDPIKSEMISLEYVFLFSREANLWNHISEFEQDLADFFSANGLDASPITTLDGATGKRMMLIQKIDIDQTLENTKGVNIQMVPQQKMHQKSSAMVRQMAGNLNTGGRK